LTGSNAWPAATGRGIICTDEVTANDESRRWQIRHNCDAENPADRGLRGPWLNALWSAGASRRRAWAGIHLAGRGPRKTLYLWCSEPPSRWTATCRDDRPLGACISEPREITIMAGCPPHEGPCVAYDDFALTTACGKNKVLAAIAPVIPQFDSVKSFNGMASGHYDYNTLDQNAMSAPTAWVRKFPVSERLLGSRATAGPCVGARIAEWIGLMAQLPARWT